MYIRAENKLSLKDEASINHHFRLNKYLQVSYLLTLGCCRCMLGGRTRATYRQVSGWIQEDDEQRRREAVVGLTAVGFDAHQRLWGKKKEDEFLVRRKKKKKKKKRELESQVSAELSDWPEFKYTDTHTATFDVCHCLLDFG